MKHNPIGINRGLYSLEKLIPQNQNLEKNTRNPSHSPELLFVEPNILIVSWRKICNNPLATKVWGANIV